MKIRFALFATSVVISIRNWPWNWSKPAKRPDSTRRGRWNTPCSPGGYESVYPYAAGGRLPGEESEFVLPDPLIWMAFVASATSKIKLGTAVLILPQHNPVITAKQVGTLDHLSNGRIILGIGVGWLKEEFDAIGAPFADRGRRADEYVAAMRELWSSPEPTFHGEFVNFDKAYCLPQPVNKQVPIVIGGDSKFAARRAGRLGDGYFPARGSQVELIKLARETALKHDRDPDAIEITTSLPDDLDEIPQLAKNGISRLAVPVSSGAGLKTVVVKHPRTRLSSRTSSSVTPTFEGAWHRPRPRAHRVRSLISVPKRCRSTANRRYRQRSGVDPVARQLARAKRRLDAYVAPNARPCARTSRGESFHQNRSSRAHRSAHP